MIDEDEVEEVVSMDGNVHAIILTGIEFAMARARSAYIAGRIEVEEFETEVERLLLKRDRLMRHKSVPEAQEER